MNNSANLREYSAPYIGMSIGWTFQFHVSVGDTCARWLSLDNVASQGTFVINVCLNWGPPPAIFVSSRHPMGKSVVTRYTPGWVTNSWYWGVAKTGFG